MQARERGKGGRQSRSLFFFFFFFFFFFKKEYCLDPFALLAGVRGTRLKMGYMGVVCDLAHHWMVHPGSEASNIS
jgi:hypothetical protein